MTQNGTYRHASKDDRDDFLRLWLAFLEEGVAQGSHLMADDHNLGIFMQYFDAYVSGQLRGVATLWYPDESHSPVGALLAGEQFGTFEWHIGTPELATMWGIYVEPEYRGNGVSVGLGLYGARAAQKLGFPGAKTGVRTNNPSGQEQWKAWNRRTDIEVTEVCLMGLFAPLGEE